MVDEVWSTYTAQNDKTHSSGLKRPGNVPTLLLSVERKLHLTSTVQSELMLYFYPAVHTTNLDSVPAIAAAQDQRLVGMFELIDDALKNQRYLVGSEMTICDHFLLMLCIWADELTKPPLAFSNLNQYLVDIVKRDAVKEVCENEGIDLSSYS